MALQIAAQDLLLKAQCVSASIEKLNGNVSIPDDLRKELADQRHAIATFEQAQKVSLTRAATTASGAATLPGPVGTLLTAMKHHFAILESGRVLNAGPKGRDLPDDLVDSMSQVQQMMLSMQPIGVPNLDEPLEFDAAEEQYPTGDDDDMESVYSVGNVTATAMAIREQIRNASPEDTLQTIQLHLRTFPGKGIGKGNNRFHPK